MRGMIAEAKNNFRLNLRVAMQSKGISQRVLAARAETSYAYVNRVLGGIVEPSLDWCDRVADAIGISLAAMLEKPPHSKRRVSA